jgi:steroid delta-isomerase-like uncharacterized protein
MSRETLIGEHGAIDAEFARDWSERFLAAWNSHDGARLAALCIDDVVWEDPFIHPDGILEGTAALREWVASLWTAMPDLEFRLVGEPFVSVDGSELGAAWAGSGHFTGPLDPPGFAPTGGLVQMVGFDVHQFRHGRLSRVTTTTDVNAVARQIGAAPPPGSIGEKAGVAVQRLMARRLRSKR